MQSCWAGRAVSWPKWSGVGRLQAATLLLSGVAARACRLYPALPARNGLTPAMADAWWISVRCVRIAATVWRWCRDC